MTKLKIVYVVMGNDFPEAVYADQDKAEAFLAKERPKNKHIYWRVYAFEVRS